ncbi:MAG TPA: hypothetical protein VFG11_03330 [Acidobacteriota bacterium]|nr:hypothetical protein [Acidobacteriota bacterium]
MRNILWFLLVAALALPAILIADQPKGTYVTTITEAEAPSEMREQVAGMWEVTFLEKNQFTVACKGETVVKGEWSINQGQVTFSDKEGRLSCPEGEKVGTYKWALNGKTLTFTKVKDVCKGRQLVLLTHPLSKKE